jgi:hypothetical protein
MAKTLKPYHLDAHFERRKYKCVVGIGFYFSGFRIDARGAKKPISESKLFQPILHTIETLNSDAAIKNNFCLIILDDASPLKPSSLISKLSETNDVIHIQLKENRGIGDKENILQNIGIRLSERVFRLDADVALDSSIQPLFDAFESIPKLSCATINAGFMGYMLTRNCKYPYIRTAQVGNAIMYDSAVIRKIGFSDPRLKYFNDLDWVYRTWDLGMTSVMACGVTGKTLSSGCGGSATTALRVADAEYLVSSNRSLSFCLRRGMPTIYYRRQPSSGFFDPRPEGRYVPESALAGAVVKDLKI